LRAWLALSIVVAAATACDSVSTRFVSGLSAEQRALAADLPVHSGRLPEGSYESLGAIEGLSCQITIDDRFRVSEENAMEELRRAAFQAGGNAVMEVDCVRQQRLQSSRRCFDSILCQGVAVRTTGAGSD
jgi:hypothetical protein